MSAGGAEELTLAGRGALLSGEQSGGSGRAIVLLHGLTATRRYVVMGSRTLERAGHRVISYDARGHGRSSPAATGIYTYEALAEDLESVLDSTGVQSAVLAGVSMGAHTALRFAIAHPERVDALAVITPAFEPDRLDPGAELAVWDRLAHGLRDGGVEGFVQAYDLDGVPDAWHEVLETVLHQRLSAHEHPLAVADALEQVPRSRPFEDMAELETIAVPTVIVASRDQADPIHPLAVGERYAATIPSARLVVEGAGPPPQSPIAWQGGQLSKLIDELVVSSRT
ncbi:MAG: alpha/beta fold hydrolase [Solirubrobacteraceae bacterium]